MNVAAARILRFVEALLAATIVLAASTAGAVSIRQGPVLQCSSEAAGGQCRRAEMNGLGTFPRDVVLARRVLVSTGGMPVTEPLSVWLVAMGSSEVRWNGVLVGRNGVPGSNAASERAGRFIASIIVPPERVKPGANLVTVRLSSHHLWLPVRRTVHEFEVGPYRPVVLPGLAYYLPALLTLGALTAAGLFFAVTRILDRADRAAQLLAFLAGIALLQLALETSRSFILYAYPWHLVRVGAVAVLAGASAILIAAYAGRRFAPDRQARIVLVASAAAAASLLFIPWYDIKALVPLAVSFLLVLSASWTGWKRGIAAARPGAAAACLFFVLLAWQRTALLDRAYYIFLAALLILLAAERVLAHHQTRRERETEGLRADRLQNQLNQIGASRTALLKDGSRTHHVSEDQISYARAADDYSEVILRDGRVLLVTTNLARLLDTLSARFVRVHKSFVVNREQISLVQPRPGGGRQIVLSDGSRIPVGRSYRDAVQAAAST